MAELTPAIVRHFASGDAFFTGVICILLAVAWRTFRWKGGERVVWLLAVVGAAVFIASSSSMLNGGSLLSEFVTLGWLILGRPPGSLEKTQPTPPSSGTPLTRRLSVDHLLSIAVALLWLFEGFLEVQWRRMPELSQTERYNQVVVLGDSLTAGLGDDSLITWPQRLHDKTGMGIVNHSAMGQTLETALKQFPNSIPENSLVIILLGGNDLLGNTSGREFRERLDELLQRVTSDASETMMFELPLPPFSNSIGQAQRDLAKRYKVKLIPKRVLSDILFSEHTTLDSIHLNQSGQDQLAEIVESMLHRP